MLEKAFQLKDRLSEKERLFIDAWYARAQGDDDGEVRALRRLIAAYPRETEAYSRLAYRLTYLDQLEEAITVYERGLAIDSDAKDIWNNLGFLYNSIGRYSDVQLGRYREAIEQYRRYIELAPSDWDRAVGYNHLALVYWRQGDLLSAEQAARQEHRLNHDFGTALRLAVARGDWRAAESLESQYFGTPSSPTVGKLLQKRDPEYLRGAIALAHGQYAKAEEHFRAALKIPHLLWGINSVEDCLAQAYEAAGRMDDATREYERILALNPHDALTHYRLARLLDRRGFSDRAADRYARFLALWKDADADIPEVRAARARLRPGAIAMR